MKPPIASKIQTVRSAQEIAAEAGQKVREAQKAHTLAVLEHGRMSPEALAAKVPFDAARAEAEQAALLAARALNDAAPKMAVALDNLADAMRAVGIASHDATALLQQFTITIAQAQAKAAMRQENTK